VILSKRKIKSFARRLKYREGGEVGDRRFNLVALHMTLQVLTVERQRLP
jgi:hypothetical protein